MSASASIASGHNRLRQIGGVDQPIQLTKPPPRLRPGERPVWIDLTLSDAEARHWRARAASYGLHVDAWLGLLLEHQLVCDRLGRIGAMRRVLEEATRSTTERRLPPTPELRRWVVPLEGRDTSPLPDDLPSVVLAERLVAQIPPNLRGGAILEAAESGHETDAILLERAAASSGRTIETWAYLTALGAI